MLLLSLDVILAQAVAGYQTPSWIEIVQDYYGLYIILVALIAASIASGRFLVFTPMRSEIRRSAEKTTADVARSVALLETKTTVEIARLDSLILLNETRFHGEISRIRDSLDQLRSAIEHLSDNHDRTN